MTRSAHRIAVLAAVAAVAVAVACAKDDPPPAAEAPLAEPANAPPTTQPHDHPAEPAAAVAEMPPAPAAAKVFFVAPAEGAVVKGPVTDGKVAVKVQMGVEGIEVKPAGPVEAGSGHHHVLIDTPALARGTVVPADDSHIHFGKGQTEAEIMLSRGAHSLTLQFADGIHRSYGPELAATIKLTVEADGAAEGTTAEP